MQRDLILKTDFPVKTTNTHKISISVFSYENKEKHPVYASKRRCEEKHFDWYMHYIFIKDFNTFVYVYTFYCVRKQIYCYCQQAFSMEKELIWYIKDYFKINNKQSITMPKRVNKLDSKIKKK